MDKLKFNVSDEMMSQITAEAERLWPGQGAIAVGRLIRDSIRRPWKYCGGKGKPGSQDAG